MKENATQTEMFSEEAEAKRIARQEALVDNIGRKQGGPYPNTVKPEKLFQKFHKPHKKRSKSEIYQKAMAYLEQKKAKDAINTEESTPLDEEKEVLG